MAAPLTLKVWDAYTPAQRKACALRVLRENLPVGFEFRRLRACKLGVVSRQVAEYTFRDGTFALIPGGTVQLGYPANRPWEPTPAEQASWDETAEEYGITVPLRKYIASVTRRPRRVRIDPFVLETTATEPGWVTVVPTDPEVRKCVREHLRGTRPLTVEIHSKGSQLRVRRHEDGSITAERAAELTHAGVAAWVRKSGCRLPTENEWEYACGGGATTLFRWGDHVPCDCYPVDQSKWDLHRRPNGFGLSIASNPYHYELVAEPGRFRGGDGGGMICGGAGFFVGWLTLATAYFQKELSTYDPTEPLMSGFVVARRAFTLR